MTLSDIVLTYPRTIEVMERYHLDFCCGGKQTMSEACASKGLALENICDELQALISSPKKQDSDPSTTLSDLCDQITYQHHSYVRHSTETIGRYLNKLVSVHGQKHPELSEVQSLFENLSIDLRLHMRKEEVLLFPYIKELEEKTKTGGRPVPGAFKTVGDPIGVMEFEHEAAGGLMEKIRQVTNNYAVPEDGCTTYRLTYAELAAFERDLHRHVHLENHLLFPKSIVMEKELLANRQSNN